MSSDQVTRPQYRSTLGIIRDVLQACMDSGMQGTLISEISRKANLSHYAALGNCRRLATAGLLTPIRTKRNNIFSITEKGIRFFHEFERFHEIAKELKIRY